MVCVESEEIFAALITPPHLIRMVYVYVLKSLRDKALYIGSTRDLRKRVADHNDGKVFSTRLRRPFKLLYYEAYQAEKDARDREHNLKLRANALNQLKRRLRHTLHAD